MGLYANIHAKRKRGDKAAKSHAKQGKLLKAALKDTNGRPKKRNR